MGHLHLTTTKQIKAALEKKFGKQVEIREVNKTFAPGKTVEVWFLVTGETELRKERL